MLGPTSFTTSGPVPRGEMKKFLSGPNDHPQSPNLLNSDVSRITVPSGLLLLGSFALLACISGDFSFEIPLTERPVILLVSILILSAAVYLFTVYAVPKINPTRSQLLWIIAVGIVLRLLMVISTPMLEDDYLRYLWDGAVTANGINPYQHSPEQVIQNTAVPSELAQLKSESGEITGGINHPHLRTIYPPIAQAFFAVSYLIKPWSMTVWKIILMVSDLVTLALLFYAFRFERLPQINLIIYWWNPLLVKEIFNSGHLDVLVFPFALGAIILASRSKYTRSALSLAAGIGIKLWPAFLLPVILRPLISYPKKLIATVVLIIVLLLLIFLPFYISGLDQSSGLVAYSRSWQNNASAFRILVFISELSLDILGFAAYHKYTLARVIMALLIAAWAGFVTFKRSLNNDLFKKSLFITAFVFLISPASFPWYYTWLLPFLTLRPRFSLLLLTLLLPLYYLRYYLEPRGEVRIFNDFVVWIEFVPVWAALFLERKRDWKDLRST